MNSIHKINDFTQTEGYGNSFKKKFILKVNPEKEPLMKNGFKSYDDYLEYYNRGDKRGKIRLKTKLENLAKYLEQKFGYYIDPILYLANLYYGEGLATKDVHSRVVNKGMNYTNDNSLEKTFNLTFGWKLRDSSGSEITKKKSKNKTD